MSGLFLVHDRDAAFAEAALAEARAQFVRHGFRDLSETHLPGWHVLHAPHILGGPVGLFADGEDFAAVAGTFSYDGLLGRPALEALLREADPSRPDWTRIAGQFVLVLRKAGRTSLLTDYFAAFQLFHDPAMRLFSTSLLAAAQALPKISFDAQGVYEFAFNIFPVGDDSVFAELTRLGPDQFVELTEDGVVLLPQVKPLPEAAIAAPLAHRIARHRQRLAAVVGSHVAHFGDHVQAPLSGGLDSRLLLATLREQGCRPHVYVYGSPGSEDVGIARAIGIAEGFEVECVDKAAYRRIAPDEFAHQVERNFHENDAIPTYGGIFDNGGNSAARDARNAGGSLAASGGCGEVYRNFFYLPDRPTTAAAVTRSFFARFTAADATALFDEDGFLRAIDDKILAALGVPGERGPLPRGMIEQIYPRVRCRALFGREISQVGRYGAYLMPFLDHQVVAEAMTLPLGLKNAGRFEAALLAAIDPVLARQPSAYGHHFAEPPNARHRFDEWSTRIRPVWLRQRSYAIHRRLKPMSDEHGGLLSPDYMERVIDLGFPAVRRYFQMSRITDSGLWRRIACLEYLAAYLGSRLADA